MRTTAIGSLDLTMVSDGGLDLPAEWFAPLPPGVTPERRVTVGSNGWLVRTPTRTILVDGGAGEALSDAYPRTGRMQARVVDEIRRAGGRPGDVTDIVLTHMHADHMGGLLRRRFPNAVIHVHHAEWAFWTDPATEAALPAATRPIAQLIRRLAARLPYPVERHGGMLDLGEGIHVMPAPGHTPGHTVLRLSSGGAEAMLLADALICAPMQLSDPRIRYALDVDPAAAVATRTRLLDMLAADAIPCHATHMNCLSLGQMRRQGAGYVFGPA